MANRITVILDALGFDKGSAQVKGFRQQIAEADGATGKLKAGTASLSQTISANMGPAMLAGAGAAVAFGVKAVGAFTDTAKAAIDMGAATGLATEDASRWIAVGDDMGVTAEELTAGIGKIAKTLDDSKWGKYGIETRTAAGEARSANDVLIDTLDMLGKVSNETERARIGNDLFGKGYKSLAPIVGKTAAEYRKYLGEVEDGQVITEAEAKKAERMRLAQDALADTLNEVTLAVGSFAASFAPAIEEASQFLNVLIEIDRHTGALETLGNPLPSDGGKLGDRIRQLAELGKNEQELTAALRERGESEQTIAAVVRARAEMDAKAAEEAAKNRDVAAEQRQALHELASQYDQLEAGMRVAGRTQELTAEETRYLADLYGDMEAGIRDLIPGVNDLEYAQDRAAETTRDMAAAAAEAQAAYDEFTTSLSNEQSLIDVQRLLDEFPGKLAEIDKAEKQGAITAEEAQRQRREAVLATKDEVFKYLTEVQKIPPERATEIVATLDWGSVSQVEDEIEFLRRTRDAYINVHSNYVGANGQGSSKGYTFAEGGFTGRGGKNDIAGIVHKGEYVLPQEMVDQTTGKPKGFAAGGFTGPTITHTTIMPATVVSSTPSVAAGPTPEEAKAEADRAAREAVEREDEIQAAMYETGQISLDAYRKYVEGRQNSEEKNTKAWLEQWRILRGLREEEAAQQKKLHDEELAREEEALKKRKEAAEATLEAIKQAYEQARAIQRLQQAERDVADALNDIVDAEQELADVEDDKDRKRAAENVQRAIERAGQEMFSGAGARAEANGFAAGTVEWARFVRREVEQAMKDYPQLAGVLGNLLVGVPRLASGGIVKARPGGTLAVLGEAGKDEMVTPLDGRMAAPQKVFNINVHAFDGRGAGAAVVKAIKEYELANGKVFSNR
jgi:hypothetical protein